MQPVKFCNCKASKCAKAYCECFAAKQYCGKNCHCLECLNRDGHDPIDNKNLSERKPHPQFKGGDEPKPLKGCACKKSGCMKKYCECFNAGFVCIDLCKCVDCQNTDTSVNRKIIRDLKKNDLDKNPHSLYRVLLAQNEEHLNAMVLDADRNNPDLKWLSGCAETFYEILKKEEPPMDPTQGIPDHPFSNKTKEILDVFEGMLLEIVKEKKEGK